MKTYGSIEALSDGWRITKLEPHVALRLKAIFPKVPKTSKPPIEIKGGTGNDADVAWFLKRYPMKISDKDRKWLDSRVSMFQSEQDEIETIIAGDWEPSQRVEFREGKDPYPYQYRAMELARRKGRLLLMDDLGLGKTVSGIATICDKRFLPALVVPQTHLVDQWFQKVMEFTHLTPHVIKKSKPYLLPQADVFICPYSKLSGWVDYARQGRFKSVVFDEMQDLRRGRETAKGNAAEQFCDHAILKMGLTATPIYNYGDEIFNLIELLEPGALGSRHDFYREWCECNGTGKWIVKDPQALGTFLLENHLALRRTNEDVGNEFPPLNVVNQMIAHDEEVVDNQMELLRKLAATVVSVDSTFTERGMASREFDLRLRHATGVAKAPHVAAFVDMLLKSGEPVVLCGWHRDVYDIWLRHLAHHRPLLYTGSESPAAKERTKRHFIGGTSNLMIMSLRSGAGLDGLQERCRTIVFGELDWSPQVHAQCCGRLRRPGQKQQVDAYYLNSDGGSDPSVMGVLGLKASQSHGIVNPLSAPVKKHSDDSRIKALASAFLEGKLEDPPEPVPDLEPGHKPKFGQMAMEGF